MVEENQKPVVSVIVPCYNYGHLLAETLDSLQKQTFQSWECIIVDDGSVDDTREVAARFIARDKRYNYLYQTNAGLSAARNTGILASRGEFIQLLDADDLIAENKLLNQINLFKSNADISIVYSEVRYFKSENPAELFYSFNKDAEPWMEAYSTHLTFTTALMHINLFAVNCALFRKDIISSCGLFNTQLKSVEDWEFWVRCSLQHKVFLFDRAQDSIALVRVHGNSMSQNIQRMHEASLHARIGLHHNIRVCNLAFKKELADINSQQIAYLHRTLYAEFNEKNKLKRLKHLLKGFSLHKEWRHIVKEIFKLFRQSKI